MKVSLIIPIYNVSQYVERCLKSVFNQSYNDMEVIIVDDCGNDNSMEIVLNVIKQYNFHNVRIVHHEHNRGLSAARNTGVQNACGEYVLFLDSDDTIPEDAVENLVKTIDKYGEVDFVIGEIKVFGKNIEYPLLSADCLNSNIEIFNDFMLMKWNVMGCNKLIKRDFIQEKQLYFAEGMYHEDLDFSFNLAINARSMACCHHVTYNYFIRENSISTRKTIKNYNDILAIIKNNFSKIRQLPKDRSQSRLISNYIVEQLYIQLIDVVRERSPQIPIQLKKEYVYKLQNELNLNQAYTRDVTFPYRIKKIILTLPYMFNFYLLKVYIKIRGIQ